MHSPKAGIENYMQIHCKRKMLPLLFINFSLLDGSIMAKKTENGEQCSANWLWHCLAGCFLFFIFFVSLHMLNYGQTIVTLR